MRSCFGRQTEGAPWEAQDPTFHLAGSERATPPNSTVIRRMRARLIMDDTAARGCIVAALLSVTRLYAR